MKQLQPTWHTNGSEWVKCAVCLTPIRTFHAHRAPVKTGSINVTVVKKGWTTDHHWQEWEVREKKPVYKTLYVCLTCLGKRRATFSPPIPTVERLYDARDIMENRQALTTGLVYDPFLHKLDYLERGVALTLVEPRKLSKAHRRAIKKAERAKWTEW